MAVLQGIALVGMSTLPFYDGLDEVRCLGAPCPACSCWQAPCLVPLCSYHEDGAQGLLQAGRALTPVAKPSA